MDQTQASGRIGVEFRVGITGHRSFPHHERVGADIAIALERILGFQSVRGTASTPVGLTIVSALAEGADRILVEQAGALGPFRLEAILPMPADEYVNDFATQESRNAFRALLDSAATTLVVGHAEQRVLAYELAGKAVVDRCDVLIAVWDENRKGSAGGTASTVAYARARRVPLFWVHLDGTNRITPEWGDSQATSPLRPIPVSPHAFKDLDRFNRRTIPPSFASTLVHLPASLDAATESRLDEFVRWATPYFRRAEENARHSQFLSYAVVLLLYGLASTAVGIAIVELAFRIDNWLTWVESGMLVGIAVMLILLWRIPSWHWHDNWVATRSLAERIRSAAFLGVAGVGDQVDSSMDAAIAATPDDEWLSRAYREVWLRRPQASIHRADLGAMQTLLADVWIADQITYHAKAATRYERWREGFRWSVLGLFGFSVAASVLDSLNPPGTGGPSLFGLLAVAIPAFAATVSGYAAQREFGQLADRSRRMEARLTETRRRIGDVDSLDEMQTLALTAEQQMRGETADWYSLVRLHKPDVPV